MSRSRRSHLKAVKDDRPTTGAMAIAALWSSDSTEKAPILRNWRAPLGSSVSMSSSESEDVTIGEAVNISVTGLQVLTEHPYPCGAELKLEFSLPGDSEVKIRCSGEVVWSDEEGDGDDDTPAGMGLRLLELDDIDRQAIQKLLHETHGPKPRKVLTRHELLELLSQKEAEVQPVKRASERADVKRRKQIDEPHQTLKESQSQVSREKEAAASSTREDVALLTNTREMLQSGLLQIQQSLSKSELTTSSLEARVQQLEGSLRVQKPGRQQLAEAVESAQRQTDKLLATLEETNDKLSRTQVESAELEQRLAESSSAKAEAERLAGGSGEASAALRVELESSSKRAATAEAESTKHQLRIDELESVLSGLRREIVDLSRKHAEMESLHKAELERACSELRTGEESRASLVAELKRSASEREEFAQKVGITLEAVRKSFAAQEELAKHGRSVAKILEDGPGRTDENDARPSECG